MRIPLRSVAALLVAALPLAALAHVDAAGAGATHAHADFLHGLVHPFTGLDHLAAMLVAGLRMPAVLAGALVGVFALFHGLAHGSELAGGAGAVAALTGMVAATLLLHAAGIAGRWMLRERGAWLPRAVGAAAALFGASLLAPVA